jgi:hypothetical protein
MGRTFSINAKMRLTYRILSSKLHRKRYVGGTDVDIMITLKPTIENSVKA